MDERFENLDALKRDTSVIASGLEWAGVHGNLCLALRHPQNVDSRGLMLTFVKRLGKLLVEWEMCGHVRLKVAVNPRSKTIHLVGDIPGQTYCGFKIREAVNKEMDYGEFQSHKKACDLCLWKAGMT